MKARVISSFIDKYTREKRPVGSELEVTEERFEEIMQKNNLLERVEEPDTDVKEEKEETSKEKEVETEKKVAPVQHPEKQKASRAKAAK